MKGKYLRAAALLLAAAYLSYIGIVISFIFLSLKSVRQGHYAGSAAYSALVIVLVIVKISFFGIKIRVND